jgi:hypothetical protein
MGCAEEVLSALELEELRVTLEAFLDRSAVDESPRADSEEGVADVSAWARRRADAFMEMVRTVMAHAQDGHAVGADRYLVHAVTDVANSGAGGSGRSELIDGTPLEPSILSRILCDCSIVAHAVKGHEPLNLGRKTKVWNTAQRRAITVRDGGRCRFVGCGRSRCDIHHLHWWSKGGATDVAGGFLCCDRHHTLLHGGFHAEGDANHELTFFRPDGTVISTSTPPGAGAFSRLLGSLGRR